MSIWLDEYISDPETRLVKARTIRQVLRDYLGGNAYSGGYLGEHLLDVGCSTGLITGYLWSDFNHATGIDKEATAIRAAQRTHGGLGFSISGVGGILQFCIGDIQCTDIVTGLVDVAVCNHVYEHVEDAELLMWEIHRVLKPGGICYFSTKNRLFLPDWIRERWLKSDGKVRYGKERTYWGLKRLVKDFVIHDYTKKMVDDVDKYGIRYMVDTNVLRGKFMRWFINRFYWLSPGYVWILEKR